MADGSSGLSLRLRTGLVKRRSHAPLRRDQEPARKRLLFLGFRVSLVRRHVPGRPLPPLHSPSPFFYKMDIIGTACFSISIVPGSILATTHPRRARILLLAIYGGVIFSAVSGSQAVLEVLYLVPMVLAAVAGVWFLWRVNTEASVRQTSEATRKRIRKWSAVAAVGALMAGGGIVGDKWMCLLFGTNFSMLFWAFFGSNVALFAFFPIHSINLVSSLFRDQRAKLLLLE
jgi:hypothetical protein